MISRLSSYTLLPMFPDVVKSAVFLNYRLNETVMRHIAFGGLDKFAFEWAPVMRQHSRRD
jgi:hypothetical protein